MAESHARHAAAQAREAARALALASAEAKNAALPAAAREMRAQTAAILDANARDLGSGRRGRPPAAFLDRLMLDPKRVEAMAKGLEEIAALPDPVGSVIATGRGPTASRSSACACRSASSASSTRAGPT